VVLVAPPASLPASSEQVEPAAVPEQVQAELAAEMKEV
jgi:hypothetical protein